METKAFFKAHPGRFEEILTIRNDAIDNAAFDLLRALATTDVEWDMAVIQPVVEAAGAVLDEHKIGICHPFCEGEDETPCVIGADCKANCPYCERN